MEAVLCNSSSIQCNTISTGWCSLSRMEKWIQRILRKNLANTRNQEFYSYFDVYVHTVTRGTHGTHGNTRYTSHFTHSLLAFKYFPSRGTKVCIPLWKISISSICSQEVTAWFTTASLSNHLTAGCFLRGPKKYKSLGPIPRTGEVTADGLTAERLWTPHPAVPISCPVISISSARLRSTWLAKHLKDADVKQAVTSWLHLAPIYCTLLEKMLKFQSVMCIVCDSRSFGIKFFAASLHWRPFIYQQQKT